jgi:hypothetical protein
MSAATENRAVREVIALACRTYGRKSGWHRVAQQLGVTERWIKAATYGEPTAPPDPLVVQEARLALARQRAAQIKAELATLEGPPDGTILDHRQPHLEPAR